MNLLNIQIYKQLTLYFLALVLVGLTTSCDKDGSFNIFSVQDDIALGRQVSEEIENDPSFNILPEAGNEAAYAYIRRLRDRILSSDDIIYREEFPWQIRIVVDDNTLNAFATPGGYIYVYTGLIKYLDSEDQLAGVLAHEVAHSDRRHTTDNLTRAYGVQLLLDIVLGNRQGAITEVAKGLLNLRYGRGAEREADEFSVAYLCDTNYKSDGAAGFFIKLQEEGQGQGVPEFLSTHPNPGNRIEAIQAEAQKRNCNLTPIQDTQYQAFKNALPGGGTSRTDRTR